MKKQIYMLAASALSLLGTTAVAQQQLDARYGEDPATREQNVRVLNFFNNAYQSKDYTHATLYLRELIQKAPKASENMYIRGIDIYKTKAAMAQTKADRKMFVDSALWVFDQRIAAFGEHPKRGTAYLRCEKARLYLAMMPGDVAGVERLCSEALAETFHPDIAVNYFRLMVDNFKIDDITPEELIAVYEKLMGQIATLDGEAPAEAGKTIESLFATSGAANCETIEKIYKPKYEADPQNAQLVENILALLQRGKCTSDFYMTMLESYYKVNPKPEVAIQLAGFFQEKKDYTKAMEYLRVGIEKETDSGKKVNFLLQAAGMVTAAGSYREAAGFARQALTLDPNNGYAYMLLGAAIGSGAANGACGGFDMQTAMWLAVDNLALARKNLPADDPQQARISQLIGNYSANFPKTEETFMRGLNPGDSYSVNCGWISGRTTVRER